MFSSRDSFQMLLYLGMFPLVVSLLSACPGYRYGEALGFPANVA